MATTADRKVNLVPPKLQRLRRAHISLQAELSDAKERQREIREKLASAQHNLSELLRQPGAYLSTDEKTELQKEIEAAQAAVDRFEELKADVTSEVAEIHADYQPLCATVRSLERHLGLAEDEHLFEGHKVTGGGDNFQPIPASSGQSFIDADKGGES